MGRQAIRWRREALRLLVAGALAALLLAGCGSGKGSASTPTSTSASTTPSAAQTGPRTPAQRRMQTVLRAWSARLNSGDYVALAQLFTLPAVIVQGQYEYRLTTRHQIAVWHAGLPCSGEIVSIGYHGSFAVVIFRLGDLRSSKCDAPGTLTAVRFAFVKGLIAGWAQVPMPKRVAPTGPVA